MFNYIVCIVFVYRLAQTLNVYWEKTPESVLYTAIQAAVDSIDNLQLIDFTSTENVCLSHLPGKLFASAVGDRCDTCIIYFTYCASILFLRTVCCAWGRGAYMYSLMESAT